MTNTENLLQPSLPSSPKVKWSYPGMDPTPGVPEYPMNSDNILPAVMVWVTLTTNPTYSAATSVQQVTVDALSDALGITGPCVKHLLESLTRNLEGVPADAPNKAFKLVAKAFHAVGEGLPAPAKSNEDYVPDNCPQISHLLTLLIAAGSKAPVPA